MIAVIADDFTGAAEIGGIGLRHGLNVIIETEPIQNRNADLIIIATDTRSLRADMASQQIMQITEHLLQFNPEFIFKKLDSVLRGNIREELISQMKVSGKKRALVIAANPVFNRIIRDGIYYIDNIPLNETRFSSDPHYPIKSSSVREILGTNEKSPLYNLKPDDKLPETGLIIGDVSDFDDLKKWAEHMDDQTLLAGASGFFDALLDRQKFTRSKKQKIPVPIGDKALFVLGSTFPRDNDFLSNIEANGYYLSNMPKEIYFNKNFDPSCLEDWVNDIVKGINEQRKVIASIVHSPSNEPDIAFRLMENIGELIKKVVERIDLNELLIEGGSTTSVVLKYLDIKKLFPIQELDTGVIRMKIDGFPNLCLTTKPGSYFWPDDLGIPPDIQRFNNIAYD
ncbi:MAG: four-carbon acid sugar kinase family protein [Bacteroidales bacterium]|nr:MAG: four-carbon acid sugar kinase family protein [Bacteroidales bacterium]